MWYNLLPFLYIDISNKNKQKNLLFTVICINMAKNIKYMGVGSDIFKIWGYLSWGNKLNDRSQLKGIAKNFPKLTEVVSKLKNVLLCWTSSHLNWKNLTLYMQDTVLDDKILSSPTLRIVRCSPFKNPLLLWTCLWESIKDNESLFPNVSYFSFNFL